MVENVWVIQRDDGKFYVRTRKCGNRIRHLCDDRLLYALRESCESEAQETVDNYKLQNYKPVKVEIKVINDEE